MAVCMQADKSNCQLSVRDLRVEVATHIEGTAEADKLKKPGLPSRGMIDKIVARSAARGQAGTGGTVHDKEARTSAMHIDNFLEMFDDVRYGLLTSKPPIAESNPAFDEDEDFSEPIHITAPHRVLVGDESAWKILMAQQAGKAGFKIVTFGHSRQAKAQGKGAPDAAVSHTTNTDGSFSDTYVACCNLAGDTLSPLLIQQKKNVSDADEGAAKAAVFVDADGMPCTAAGVKIHLEVFANEQGGMTPAVFRIWLEKCILPHCPGISVTYRYYLILDGDYAHCAIVNYIWTASIGLDIKHPAPGTSVDGQTHDDHEGQFHTFKAFEWPHAMSRRKGWLKKNGMERPLDRSDMVPMLIESHKVSFSKTVNNKALHNVGLMPFTRAPIYREHIARTEGTERPPQRVLNASKIKFHVDAGDLENASEELCKQLGGNKYGTSNMWRYLANGPEGIALGKAFKYHLDQKRQEKAEGAERVLMRKEDALVKAVTKAEEAAKKLEAKAAREAEKKEDKKAKDEAAAKKKMEADEKRKKLPLAKQLKKLVGSTSSTLKLSETELKDLKKLMGKMNASN